MGGKGSGGRNKKTTERKKAEGNRGKRKMDLRKAVALPGEPEKPSSLSPAAEKLWPEVCSILKLNGVLFRADGIAVAGLCSSLVHFTKLDKWVSRRSAAGMISLGASGSLMTHPMVRMRDNAFKALRTCWQCFGLDPVSRSSADGAKRGGGEGDKPQKTKFEQMMDSKDSNDVVN